MCSRGRYISSSLRSEAFYWISDGTWHGLFLILIFEGGKNGQYRSLGIFMSLLLILGVSLFMEPCPKIETSVGSKHEHTQFDKYTVVLKLLGTSC